MLALVALAGPALADEPETCGDPQEPCSLGPVFMERCWDVGVFGWNIFGDEVETSELTRSEATGFHSGTGSARRDGAEVLRIKVRNALWPPARGGQAVRFWNRGPSRVAFTEAVFPAEGVDTLFSVDFDCTMAPGSLAAEITGYTSCAEPAADVSTPGPTALINPYHAHEVPVSVHAGQLTVRLADPEPGCFSVGWRSFGVT